MTRKILVIVALLLLAVFAVAQTAPTPAQETPTPPTASAPAQPTDTPAQAQPAQPPAPPTDTKPPAEAQPPAQTPPAPAQPPAEAARPKTPEKPPKYDVKAETKLKGTIVQLKQYQCPISGGLGAHFAVKSGDTVYEVHLATVKFTKDYSIELTQGANVEMVGNKITYNGAPAFLPREITIDNVTYFVRDKAGKPLW